MTTRRMWTYRALIVLLLAASMCGYYWCMVRAWIVVEQYVFSRHPRQIAENTFVSFVTWRGILSPLVPAVLLLVGRALLKRIGPSVQCDPQRRPLLRKCSVGVFWLVVCFCAANAVASPFLQGRQLQRVKEHIRSVWQEMGGPTLTDGSPSSYDTVSLPARTSDGYATNVGPFHLVVAQELAAGGPSADAAVELRPLPNVPTPGSMEIQRGEEGYASKIYFQLSSDADFYHAVSSVGEAHIESVRTALGGLAMTEMLIMKALLCHRRVRRLELSSGLDIFVFEVRGQSSTGKQGPTLYEIAVMNREGEHVGSVLVMRKEPVLCLDDVLPLAASIRLLPSAAEPTDRRLSSEAVQGADPEEVSS